MERNFVNKVSFHWAILWLLAVAIVWGTSYGVSKQILSHVSVPQLLFLRFLISCLILFTIAVNKGQISHFIANQKQYLQVGVSTGLILSCIFVTETWAVKLAQAGQVAVLISLCVLFTPILEKLWLKVQLPKGIFLLCIVGVTGMILIAEPHQVALRLDLGVGLVLVAAFLRGVMVVACRKAFTSTTFHIELITLVQLATVTVMSRGLVLLDKNSPSMISVLGSLDTHGWISLLYLALCCTLMAFFIQNYAVKHLPASQASLLMGTEPLFGLLFATVFLQETMSLFQWIGCFIVICTTIAACYKFSKQN